MDSAFHFPPELVILLPDTISKICRSKTQVLLFFRGAGVSGSMTADLQVQVKRDRDSISKVDIASTVLTRLNEAGDSALGQRREIIKRVTEFEAFSACWPKDAREAKGLVAEVRDIVNRKDSFTRMKDERDEERKQRVAERQAHLREEEKRRSELDAVRANLFSLFGEKDVWKRGKALEGVLNRLFDLNGMLVREAFVLEGDSGEGVVEQIDGVVEIDGELYLVETKWWDQRLGTAEVSQHLVRVVGRGQARGIFISASGYTDPAIFKCREFLRDVVVVLCELEEIVHLLNQGGDLKAYFKEKIRAAVIDKNPLHRPLGDVSARSRS